MEGTCRMRKRVFQNILYAFDERGVPFAFIEMYREILATDRLPELGRVAVHIDAAYEGFDTPPSGAHGFGFLAAVLAYGVMHCCSADAERFFRI